MMSHFVRKSYPQGLAKVSSVMRQIATERQTLFGIINSQSTRSGREKENTSSNRHFLLSTDGEKNDNIIE